MLHLGESVLYMTVSAICIFQPVIILEQYHSVMLPVLLLLLFSFRKLGDKWSVDQEVTDELEAFICLMYGHAREKSVNTVRSIMSRKMVGVNEELTTKPKVDLSRLPPFRDSLVPHIARANYRITHYKRVHKGIFQHPNPYNLGLIDLLEKTDEEAGEAGKQEEGQEVD